MWIQADHRIRNTTSSPKRRRNSMATIAIITKSKIKNRRKKWLHSNLKTSRLTASSFSTVPGKTITTIRGSTSRTSPWTMIGSTRYSRPIRAKSVRSYSMGSRTMSSRSPPKSSMSEIQVWPIN